MAAPLPVRPSPIGLAVLGLLCGGPLHPYGIQRLLKEWGKDQVVNVGQRSSLYKAIGRLEESGLVAVRQTERHDQYPERTVYEITGDGRRVVTGWLTDMLSTPRHEFPTFPAALSFAMLLGPDGVRSALARRSESLEGVAAALRTTLLRYSPELPRITLIETEYQLAVTEAELRWLHGVVNELADGAFTWSASDFAGAAGACTAAGD